MEYKRAAETGIIEIWKEEELIGQVFPMDELWKRKVYLTISGEVKTDRRKEKKAVNQ